MSFSSFISDRNATRRWGDWLTEFYPKNPSGVETPIYVSRRGTVSGVSSITIGSDTIAANTLYKRRLITAPTLTQSLWAPGQILSSSIPSFGTAKLSNKDGGLDQYMPSQGWVWAGCRYKSYFADKRTRKIASTIGKVADGIMGDPLFNLEVVEIPLLGRESLFDAPLSTYVYRGTGAMLELFGDRTISYGAPAPANITGNFTIEGWVWLDALPTVGQVYYGWVGGTRYPWRKVISPAGLMRLQATIGGIGETISSTAALAIQRFYHFAIAVSGRDVTFVLYDDSTQVETVETLANAFTAATRDSNVGSTYLHRTANDATFRPWLDEYRLWNFARSLTEIRTDRFREIPSGSIPATLVHYPRFNDGTGTLVVDSSATGANGTISGAGTSTWLHSQEGGPELSGTPKPYCSGEKFGAAPVLVDPVRQGYQVAGGGAIQDETTFEGGSPHTMVASSVNFRTYLTTTPAAGTSLRYLPRGLFKLGSSPTLPVAATVKGYNNGPLGYVNQSATVARDIITRRGPKLADPADLDTASFTAFLAASPGIIGLYYQSPDPENDLVKSALDSVVKSGAGWWGNVRASTLFHLEKYAGPGAVADYNFDQKRILSVTPVQVSAVIYQVIVRYRENMVVHSEDQVAASVKGTANWQQWTKQWQEKPATDDALRTRYPGKASVSVAVDTLLQYDQDAQSLADYLLSVLKGQKEGWLVTVDAAGLQATMGETATLAITLQRGRQRLNLDGVKKYLILTVADNRQEGKVAFQVLG